VHADSLPATSSLSDLSCHYVLLVCALVCVFVFVCQALSSGQVMTFRECLLWPSRIKLDMEAAGKTLNGEKLKLVEELDWRCERFVKTLAELTTTAQKVRKGCLGPSCVHSCMP
jgi:hypothetical protein